MECGECRYCKDKPKEWWAGDFETVLCIEKMLHTIKGKFGTVI